MKTAEEWIKENICMAPDEIREFRGDRIAELMKSYAKEHAIEFFKFLRKKQYDESDTPFWFVFPGEDYYEEFTLTSSQFNKQQMSYFIDALSEEGIPTPDADDKRLEEIFNDLQKQGLL